MYNMIVFPSVVPFDASIDTGLGHRNLVIIYVVVWAVQMAYAAYAVHCWRVSNRPNDPRHSSVGKASGRQREMT
jgi:steroid 5-alpha reductase family enzyme